MLRRPDVDEVMEYGRALGFDLTPTEARMIQARMMDTIAALETFDEMRVEERRPALRFTDRDPGRRPSAVEDTLGAFITRCRVPGAPSGPLHGKTVALKDHIALAGVPMTFSSHMMDGYVPDFDATVVTRLLDVGLGRGGGRRDGRHHAGRRSGRLDPPARRVVRDRRAHADPRPGPALRRVRARADHRLRGADGPHRGGHRGVAPGHGWARRPRSGPGRRARHPAALPRRPRPRGERAPHPP